MKSKFLISLPVFPKAKGFNHQTILIEARDKAEAIASARRIKPNHNIGEIKKVNY